MHTCMLHIINIFEPYLNHFHISCGYYTMQISALMGLNEAG